MHRFMEDTIPTQDIQQAFALDAKPGIRLAGGHLNPTWKVWRDGHPLALQALHPAIAARDPFEIHRVAEHLAAHDVPVPRLLPTQDKQLVYSKQHPSKNAEQPQAYRLWSWLEGEVYLGPPSIAHVAQAGAMAARFHAAMAKLAPSLKSCGPKAHQTEAILDRLDAAILEHAKHPFVDRVAKLAQALRPCAMQLLQAIPKLPPIQAHGDLKLANLLFSKNQNACAILDFDTLAWMPLHLEMGDALRSWSNPHIEDDPNGVFDLKLFAAGIQAYAQKAKPDLGANNAAKMLDATCLIATELAARFACDTLCENYFGWDNKRYARSAEQQWLRAQGQFSLAQDGLRQHQEAAMIAKEAMG